MLEARTFVKKEKLEEVRAKLQNLGAVFRGDYEIHNSIYSSINPILPLSDVFLRLRTIPKNIWDEKAVVVTIKQTKLEKVGKNSIIPLKKFFDKENEALDFIRENYSNQFRHAFDFSTRGSQYDMGEDQIDLEDIEGHPSIELKSQTIEGLENLLKAFEISDVIKGPSVVAVRMLLGR
jgi:adenylate cyclase class IV